jgi:hypothetical protein
MTSRHIGTAICPIWAELYDRENEATFRDFDFEHNKRNILIFIAIAVAGVSFLALTESIYTAFDSAYLALLAGRSVLLMLMIGALIVLARMQNRVRFDRLTYVAVLVLPVVASIINLVRPLSDPGNFAFDIVLLLGYYSLFNFPLRFQILPPLIISAVQLSFLFAFKDIGDLHQEHVITTAFLVANVVGVISSRERNIKSRQVFLDFQRQEELLVELETNLQHTKMLEGIVPMCSYCKRIRKDRKMWEQIEEFIGRGSNLRFSHGICPECLAEHHPTTNESA